MISKRTKIVCTIGPSTWDPKVMKQMIKEGMNVARVNGAFADPDELDRVTKLVRDIDPNIALMVDVKGPEVRLNKFSSPILIKPGDKIVIGSTPESELYPANYPNLHKYIDKGQRILIGDGDIELLVTMVRDGKIYTEVVFGELLKPGKALNLPGAQYSSTTLTDKDKVNLAHSIKLGWDFVSASFINDAASAKYVRKVMGDAPMQLIAKIESQEGVDNIDEILEVVDGIMIARGGLGVELGLEKVPMIQRKLIERSNAAGKPVITATQMLESMTSNPQPTRAEVNDVALAVFLGSDAVMLSGESSAGKYPVEAVKWLSKISLQIEEAIEPRIIKEYLLDDVSATNAITRAAAELCISLRNDIDKVIVVSKSGRTARLLARHNIKQPIYCYTSNELNAKTLMLSKGIIDTFVLKRGAKDRDSAIKNIITDAMEKKFVSEGDRVLVIGRSRLGEEFFPNIFEVVDTSKSLSKVQSGRDRFVTNDFISK